MSARRPPSDPLRVAATLADTHLSSARTRRVAGSARPEALARHLSRKYLFDAPRDADDVLDDLASMLRRGTVHGGPRHFGHFQPDVPPAAVAASTLIAAFNPQTSVRAQGYAAHAIEQHVLRFLAARIGYPPDACAAHFGSGGQEANLAALVCALVHTFPAMRSRGLRALPGDPVLYASAEAHHGLEKAAHTAGLGRDAVVRIPTDAALRLDPDALARTLSRDRAAGRLPFAVVATAGTTACGAIDPLPELAALCAREALWLHCDAAWGGTALLSPALRGLLAGLERADSVTWDAHKGLAMPLGTGMFFTRHSGALRDAFATDTPYMPHRDPAHDEPYETALPWSRRAAGIPLFVALATLGAPALATKIEQIFQLGTALRARLHDVGFTRVNDTPLPLVCFTHPSFDTGARTPGDVARALRHDGRVWLTPTTLSSGRTVLRAALTSLDTDDTDLDALVDALRRAID